MWFVDFFLDQLMVSFSRRTLLHVERIILMHSLKVALCEPKHVVVFDEFFFLVTLIINFGKCG